MPLQSIAMPNTYADFARGGFNPATLATSPTFPTLSKVPAHVAIIPSTAYHELPTSARKSMYVMQVSAGLDVVAGDQIIKITHILTGQAWPNDYPVDPGAPGYATTVWYIQYHQESTPGPGAYRALYIQRITFGGPAYGIPQQSPY